MRERKTETFVGTEKEADAASRTMGAKLGTINSGYQFVRFVD